MEGRARLLGLTRAGERKRSGQDLNRGPRQHPTRAAHSLLLLFFNSFLCVKTHSKENGH